MAKIMVIHHGTSLGGGTISFLDVVDMLKGEHEVIACCPSPSKEFAEYAKRRGHNLLPINIPIPIFNHYSGGPSAFSRTFWKDFKNIKYKKDFKEFIQQHSPDIVIVNSSVMCMLGSIIQECGIKSVCCVRETFVEGAFCIRTKLMIKMLNLNFDGVTFISNYDKNYADLKAPLTKVIADCLDFESYTKVDRSEACKNLMIPEDKFNILFAGGMSWIKGLDVMLNAVKELEEKDDTFLIIAGAENLEKVKLNFKTIIKSIISRKEFLYARRIQKLLNDKKVASRIKFVGVQKNMSNCYSACDVVAFPSNVPHQARAVYESGIYSKTIIISDYNQTKEYVKNNVNGITFKVKDYRMLAEVIEKLNYNRKMVTELGKENEKMSSAQHNYDIEKVKLNKFIETIIK